MDDFKNEFEKLQKEQEEYENRKGMLRGLSSAADAIANAPSLGEIWLKRSRPQQNSAADVEAMAGADPSSRYKTTLARYKIAKEQEQKDKELAVKRDENRIKELALKVRGKAAIDPTTGEVTHFGRDIPSQSATKIGSYLGAADAAKNVEEYGAGMDTGKISAAGDWLHELTGTQDQERAKKLADIANQSNAIMHQLSGAAITPSERENILQGIPTRKDAPNVFQGKAQATTDKMINDAEAEINAMKDAGYETSGLERRLSAMKQQIAEARRKRGTKPEISTEDQKAIQWANQNPDNPDAREILLHVNNKVR